MTEVAPYYTKRRIEFFLLHWPEVCTLAQSPGSAAGLMIPGQTPESPRVHKQKGYHGNPTRWSDVKVDVEQAAQGLVDDQQRKAVQARMHGVILASIGIVLGLRNGDALAVYHRGVERMSEMLEGESEVSEPMHVLD